jgi:hypothetical protein
MPDVKQVFISHIHEEAALGDVVKAIIEDVFASHRVRAFLSSDMRDIPAGRKWLTEITEQLDQARVIVSLISPTSLRRSWVNIELGAAWIKGLRVIPLCHSGQSFSSLPRPFGDFNGVGLDQNDAPQRLLTGIADGLGLPLPKRLALSEMLRELRGAADGIEIEEEQADESQAEGLPEEQVRILQALATAQNQGQSCIGLSALAGEADVKPAAFTHHIDQLNDLGYVHIDYLMHGDHEVRLVADGSKWLLDNGAMPD